MSLPIRLVIPWTQDVNWTYMRCSEDVMFKRFVLRRRKLFKNCLFMDHSWEIRIYKISNKDLWRKRDIYLSRMKMEGFQRPEALSNIAKPHFYCKQQGIFRGTKWFHWKKNTKLDAHEITLYYIKICYQSCCQRIIWACLTILWGWRLKGQYVLQKLIFSKIGRDNISNINKGIPSKARAF